MSEIPDTKILCRWLIRVAPTCTFWQKWATFGPVADVSPTCQRLSQLRLSVQGSSTVESPTKMGGPDTLINVLQIRSTEQPSKRYNVNPSPIWEQAIPRCGTPFNHTVQVEKPSDRRIKPSLINIGYKDLSKRRITPKASRYTVSMEPHQYDRQQTHPCHGYAFGTTQPKFIG
jgi:hypothetical protein